MSPISLDDKRRRLRASAAAIAGLMVLCGGALELRSSTDHVQPTGMSGNALPQVLSYPQALVEDPPVAQPVATPATSVLPDPAFSKSAAYDALAKGSVVQQFMAYKIVDDCLLPEAMQRWNAHIPELANMPPPNHAKNCGDLKPAQLDPHERLGRLIPALRAGVPGALVALVSREGPGGLFTNASYPGLPYQEFLLLSEEGRLAALASADPSTLDAHAALLEKTNPKTALEYQTAMLIVRRESGLEMSPTELITNPRSQRLMAALSREDAVAAMQAGKLRAAKALR